jgi:hypothetical protein
LVAHNVNGTSSNSNLIIPNASNINMSMTTQNKGMRKNMSGIFLGVQPPQSNLATITGGNLPLT